MAVLQLIARDPRGLAFLPNPKQNAPESFDSDSGHALLLGSNDLVEIGANLASFGFQPLSVDLVDRLYAPVDDDTRERIEPQLVAAMEAGDLTSVRSLHESRLMEGVYVAQLRVRTPNGPVIALAQDGVLVADEATAPTVKKPLAQAMRLRLVE
ncbi:hypothetical protein [Prescottella equi]|uniref:hypothetical protein n=1 Tax=Rhodococcus hoagii TaxID=43767 RepID=UPI00111C40DD|nr:hypothetical protein [Prescottella equi]